MIDTKLQQITHNLTGLELKIDNRRRTRLITTWETRSKKIITQYIGFSKKQIDRLYYTLIVRGFEIENYDIKYLQVLLHEIAHYKQLKKCNSPKDYGIKYDKNSGYFEAVADRYALRYYKRFLNLNKNEVMV